MDIVPAHLTTQTKDVSGSDPWFDITSISNSVAKGGFADCQYTAVKYLTKTIPSVAHPDLLNSASPTLLTTGTEIYHATAAVTNVLITTVFLFQIDFNGGFQETYEYTLVLACGPTTTGLTIN